MLSITAMEFKQLSQLLQAQCGIHLQAQQQYLVQTRLSDFTRRLGLTTFTQLITRLQCEPEKTLPMIISLMTTHETLWFREPACWNALEKSILPPLFAKLAHDSGKIKVWIAGCSTGQEAYSLAMLITELCQQRQQPELVKRFSIRAMDISLTALKTARVGEYSDFEVNRGLSLARRTRYFTQIEHNRWLLRPEIRLAVDFEVINLIEDFSGLGQFDLIFCRNVTIYFAANVRRQVLSKMVNMLTADGALFIGAGEALWDKTAELAWVEFEGCVYIKNKAFFEGK